MSKLGTHNFTKISKFLSFVLRHKPESIELTLNEHGWASVTELIEKAKPQITLTSELIKKTVNNNDKRRFSLSDDQKFIRANQGHSIDVNLQLLPKEPPTFLYHGTASRFLDTIMQEGLKPRDRQHVHLSTNIETAIQVGKRYGKPVLLKIDAIAMFKKGYLFYLSKNNIWLTKSIPSLFISY